MEIIALVIKNGEISVAVSPMTKTYKRVLSC